MAKSKKPMKLDEDALDLLEELPPKQRRFCELYVELGSYKSAYSAMAEECGSPVKDASSRIMGYRYSKEPLIKRYIAKLQEALSADLNITIEKIILELEEARLLAIAESNPAAAIAATMGKAKVAGLDKKSIELSAKDSAPVINISMTE